MESLHPVRHRVGIILVCLVALLTAREGWNDRTNPPIFNSATKAKAKPELLHTHKDKRFDLTINRDLFRDTILRPICALDGAVDLPCCELRPDPTVQPDTDFVFALTPETFPLAGQFVPGTVHKGAAALNLSLLDTTEKIEPVLPDSYLLWLPPLTRCSNVKKDSRGNEYCAPEKAEEVPEPASVVLAIGGIAALLFKFRLE